MVLHNTSQNILYAGDCLGQGKSSHLLCHSCSFLQMQQLSSLLTQIGSHVSLCKHCHGSACANTHGQSFWPVTKAHRAQDASFVATEDRQWDALKFLPGWKGGIYEAVQSTPPERISRSKLADRSGFSAEVPWLAGHVMIALAGACHHVCCCSCSSCPDCCLV